MKNYDEAVKMYQRGLSIQACAYYYDITRQAMWKILLRRNVKFRPQKLIGKDNHFYRGERLHPKRVGHMVDLAVKKGVLVRSPCEICNKLPSQAHHDDYNKPLEVRWLCVTHHREWHRINRAIPLTTKLPCMSRKEIASLGGKAGCASRWGKKCVI